MHIYDSIRATIEASSIWPRIASGRVQRMCKDLSEKVAPDLARIDGLSILQVASRLGIEHSWFIAHHESVGYFWIDVTAGQSLCSAEKEYNDAFIGTPDELTKAAKEYGLENPHLIWTPALIEQDCLSDNKPTQLTNEQISFWSKYPYGEIDFINRKQPDNKIWAAMVFNEAGHNWREVIISTVYERKGYRWRDVTTSERTFLEQIHQSGFSEIQDGITTSNALSRR